MMPVMDLDDVVDELYSGQPEDFVARRDELAKQAAKDGDRDLAGAVRALRRPSSSAALVNALARQALDELAGYLDLGEQLRQAQGDLAGDRIRSLSRRRQQVAAALVDRAVGLSPRAVTAATRRELEETLQAAVGDPAAADVIASGRLTRALSYAGFGEVDVSAATATPLTPRRRPAAPAPAPAPAPARESTAGAGEKGSRQTEPAEAEGAGSKRPPARKQATKDPSTTQQAATPGTQTPPPRTPLHVVRDDEADAAGRAQARSREVLAEQQAAARETVRRARSAVTQAQQSAAAAADLAETSAQEHAAFQERVVRLQQQLAEAREQVRRAQRSAQAAQADVAQTQRALRAAERDLERTQRQARALGADQGGPEH